MASRPNGAGSDVRREKIIELIDETLDEYDHDPDAGETHNPHNFGVWRWDYVSVKAHEVHGSYHFDIHLDGWLVASKVFPIGGSHRRVKNWLQRLPP